MIKEESFGALQFLPFQSENSSKNLPNHFAAKKKSLLWKQQATNDCLPYENLYKYIPAGKDPYMLIIVL
jgi:hypothetical protein